MAARTNPSKSAVKARTGRTLSDQYSANLDRFEAMGQEVKFAIDQEISDRGIKIHETSYRVKSLDSLKKKIVGKQLEENITSVDDVVGVRVVCLFRSDVDQVLNIIEDVFDVKIRDDKNQNNPEVFGYFSVHLVCQLKSSHNGPRYDRLRDIVFEIQIRTLCMHAWSVVSHYLDYKGDWDVPVELKRSLNALSGLFWVADSQFESVSKERARSLAGAKESAESGTIQDQLINLDTLKAYLLDRYPERKGDDQDISTLVLELHEAGYESIGSLERDLDRSADAFSFYEMQNPPVGGKFTDVGVVRVSLTICSTEYQRVRSQKYPGMTSLDSYYEEARKLLN